MSSPRGEVPPSSRTAASSARPKAGSEHSDDAQHASLSTTPTQSQMQPLTSHSNPPSASKPTGSTLRPNTALRPAIPAHDTTSTSTTPAQRHQPSASSFSSASDRNIGSYDDSNNNATIGRGQANTLRTPQTRPAFARQGSHTQRSVSYATSDLETVSAMSASEYSSGAEDDADQWRRSTSRGRSGDTSIRQGTSIGRAGLLVEPSAATRTASGITTASSQKARRPSATTRDSSKARRQSRYRTDEDYLDADDNDRFGPFDEEDDEVEPHDRGEELVRRRMKARQREKAMRKKAEKERSRLSVAYPQGQGQGQPNPAVLSPSLKPSSGFLSQRPSSPSPRPDRSSRPTTIALPPPAFPNIQQQGALSPMSQQPGVASPGGTGIGARLASGTAYPSPHGHIRRPSSTQNSSQNRFSSLSHGQQSTVGPRSSYAPQAGANQDFFAGLGASAGSVPASTDAGSSMAGSVHAEDDRDFDHDEERDTIASLADRRRRDDMDDNDQDEDDAFDDDEHAAGIDADDDDDDQDDDADVDDVEYTLKDRQDAINIEHPFGLPIWKPALYKKSRSVTRNAEIALHSIPSAAAERHLLPGNILWTVLFGSWLSLICYVSSVLINFIPLGGSRYARVVWELGGYLFWPFGKYVEVEVSPESGDRVSPLAEHADQAADSEWIENSFTPVAARFPHDHAHVVPFNSRPDSVLSTPRDKMASSQNETLRGDETARASADAGSSSGSEAHRSTPRASDHGESSRTSEQEQDENTSLRGKGKASDYGTMLDAERGQPPNDLERIEAEQRVYGYVQDEFGSEVGAAQRLGGRTAFAIFYGIFLFPFMGLVCLACWGMVFPIPMAKLTWVLLRNLATRPLALHFRSAAGIEKMHDEDGNEITGAAKKFFLPLKPGEPAPRPKSINAGKVTLQRRSKILLCTYRAVGGQYYKYTVGGVNILFVNTLPLVFFTILDFFVIERYVEHHHIKHGFLAFISGQGVIFMLALGSVIPLSYFIGMAVASISAQSSIGMGAVINATFGSIIEIILYAIALTQEKARLVEGSLIGSILAGVLLMPGLSMCSGATRRKEQRFNARSAGVTSTMLIMAIIGILTPTLFYQIYGTFQLTCEGCPTGNVPGDSWSCRRCFYEHVPPATDPFFQQNVRGLMYTCTVILVLSYGVGLWFSLRTHASQIWQNPQPVQHGAGMVSNQATLAHFPSAQRASIYKRLVPAAVMQQLLPTSQAGDRPAGQSSAVSTGAASGSGTVKGVGGGHTRQGTDATQDGPRPLQLPEHFSQEVYDRAVALTASAFHNVMQQQHQHEQAATGERGHLRHPVGGGAAQKHVSMHEEEEAQGHGGHDAPSWSRGTSLTVLLSCTVLYAIIAEILVDVVDVVLDGSGIDEKFLGITLFALVPNTTEFMNAMSFAINGNIALSMEIGSAYALQVCLIQIPAMVVFSAYYNAGVADDNLIHRSFTLIFPRWDVIAIIFSVFLLTYTYIESRSNYYRGTICILSYMVLVAGFYFAPATGDVEDPGDDNRDPTVGPAAFMAAAGIVGGAVKDKLTSFAVADGRFGASPAGWTRASGVAALQAAKSAAGHAGTAAALVLPEWPNSLPSLDVGAWAYALWASLWAR
ncbi:calcium permease [Moesziomyces antarcticus]|uniref:Related to VNX1 - Calcium/H+ antiporter n=2 Tax=Pseudozyma antarctica TaxID=84753 RepID=A0A5C3FY31_PSEA2|nr:calcium permease [Moesziomyces antarcticus]GAK66201.1 calcium permease [Moesziomyces antarcticus]SPO49254.1 related to VNX1 - Calcium/H+ antiporter [Moesziomyces antarcticus]